MFQNLRENSTIYILHTDKTPYIETGSIVRISAPIPRYPIPQTFGQPQEMMVDIVIKINGQETTLQKIPASADVANATMGGNITIASSRDAMNAEVNLLRQKSIDALASMDYHRNMVEGYDKLLLQINPEFAEKQRQQEEIASLKVQMGDMLRNMNSLMEMVKSKTLDSETSSSANKKE